MNFQTHYSRMAMLHEQRICEATKITDKSKTVPDLTLSLRTLVERYVQRRDVPQGDGVYLDDDSILNDFNPEYMDVEERLEFADAIQSVVGEEMSARKNKKPTAVQHVMASTPAVGNPAPSDIIRDDIAGV